MPFLLNSALSHAAQGNFQPIKKKYSHEWGRKRMHAHHNALRTATPTIDTSRPRGMGMGISHSNFEKTRRKIERKNEQIVESMMDIMKNGGYIEPAHKQKKSHVKTLNGQNRRASMRKIAYKNGILHKTLLNTQSMVPSANELKQRWKFLKGHKKKLKQSATFATTCPPPIKYAALPHPKKLRRSKSMIGGGFTPGRRATTSLSGSRPGTSHSGHRRRGYTSSGLRRSNTLSSLRGQGLMARHGGRAGTSSGRRSKAASRPSSRERGRRHSRKYHSTPSRSKDVKLPTPGRKSISRKNLIYNMGHDDEKTLSPAAKAVVNSPLLPRRPVSRGGS